MALAILRMVEMEKTVVEGGGVAALAALLSGQLPELKGKKVVVALCGGNIDITTLGRVIDRGLAADGRVIQITATISDRPGGLASFLKIIAEAGGSVKEINHERVFLVEQSINVVKVEMVLSSNSQNRFGPLLKPEEPAIQRRLLAN